MKDKGYPITTTTKEKLADIIEAIDSNQDVELSTPGHTMFVVGITNLGNGDYSIEVSDDTKTKTLKFDHTTGKLTGSEFEAQLTDPKFPNFLLRSIVIESKKK